MSDAQDAWNLYVLRCADGTLYTGIAVDVRRRLAEHEGSARGSRYLRGRGPLELVLEWPVGDRRRASRAEYRVKRLPRQRKEQLLRTPSEIDSLLSDL